MGTRHLYWILTGPSFAVDTAPSFKTFLVFPGRKKIFYFVNFFRKRRHPWMRGEEERQLDQHL
jgi:hypothetical protein